MGTNRRCVTITDRPHRRSVGSQDDSVARLSNQTNPVAVLSQPLLLTAGFYHDFAEL